MTGSLTTRTSVTALWAEQRNRPAFLATATPALSWQVETTRDGWRQAEYEIRIRQGATSRIYPTVSAESQNVAWPGIPLTAYENATVSVRVHGAGDEWSAWSEPVPLETGPLGPSDWVADFISAPGSAEGTSGEDVLTDARPTIRFRSVFEPSRSVESATLSATAHGVYEFVLNGQVVGDEVLAPGWTAYDSRLLFQTFDVTALVVAGANVLGATIAEGWYRERFGFDGGFAVGYDGPVALSAQLRILYTDGSHEFVTTGPAWTASATGPTLYASIYQGERYDARLSDNALADPAIELPDAVAAITVDADADSLSPAFAPPVRRIETVAAVELISTPSGGTIIDFGQNLVGWISLAVDAPAGTEIVLRHAEVLENGELGVRPLRFAAATDSYTAAGAAETWSPRFTFHGFRYAEISGLPAAPRLEDVTAVVVHSDMLRTGELVTSNVDLNRLHQNVLWGMRGNFLSIPTDCPQRDERLGWTGDIQVFAPTAGFLYDSAAFLRSWLTDLALEQGERDGIVPMVVPAPMMPSATATAAWGDSATLVPDSVFERSGDPAVLAAQYNSMRSWVDVVRGLAGPNRLWTGGFQFGDWLDPSAPPENPAAAKTDPDIIATAYFYRSARAVAAAARVLGRSSDEAEFGILAEEIRLAFLNEYVTPAGRILSDAHTAYAIAITFGLLDPAQVNAAGVRLAELVRAYGYRIRTGFVGTPLIMDALCASGQSATAYRLLLETGCPSWLYPITMGATTIWERWDSILPDGSINPGEMTSFNHYALGAVADWMERSIGGIAPAEPGYRVVRVAPILGGGLTSASATLATGYGTVAVDWTLDGSTLALRVTVPANASALVRVPGTDSDERVGSGTHEWTVEVDAGTPPSHRPLSLASTLADIVDDGEARAALETLFAETGYFIGLGWTDSGRWRADSVLANSLIMYSPENIARVDATLRSLPR